jgi:hypothetical protein
VLFADPQQVRAERAGRALRQHRHTILGAFAVADDDLAPAEVDVHHAQPHRFHDAQPRAVEHPADEGMHAAQPSEHGERLLARQHDRQPGGRARVLDVVGPR